MDETPKKFTFRTASPTTRLKREVKGAPRPVSSMGDDKDSVDEEPENKLSVFTGIRKTLSTRVHRAKNNFNKVSRKVTNNKGKMVKVWKVKFSKSPKRLIRKMSAALADMAEDEYPPLYPKMRDVWHSVGVKALSKDIHRLIYRTTVQTSGVRAVLLSPPRKEDRGASFEQTQHLMKIVKILGKRLDPGVSTKELEDLCESHLKEFKNYGDQIEFNAAFLSDLEQNYPKVFRVLRCLHQSIVLKPYSILRTVVIRDYFTRDVREEDGWQVLIKVAAEGFVQVIHMRREQSLDKATKLQPLKDKNHWEYSWEVSMLFDMDMNDLTGTRLSITKLILTEGMDPELEANLRELMKDGNRLVF